MTTTEEPDHEDWTGRLSPTDVHHVVFTRVGLGRRGYDEIEVDVFIERVEREMSLLIEERTDLRDEVSRLRAQPASPVQQMPVSATASAAAEATPMEEVQRQAVRLLAAAQQTADTYVADAEAYSRRLTLDARERSERMVSEARDAAQRIMQDAGQLALPGPSGAARSSREPGVDQQAAYLETFGQVVRVQLRTYLEALLQDVEREWERAATIEADRTTPAVGLGASRGASECAEEDGRAPAEPAAVHDDGAGDVDLQAPGASGYGGPEGSPVPGPEAAVAATDAWVEDDQGHDITHDVPQVLERSRGGSPVPEHTATPQAATVLTTDQPVEDAQEPNRAADAPQVPESSRVAEPEVAVAAMEPPVDDAREQEAAVAAMEPPVDDARELEGTEDLPPTLESSSDGGPQAGAEDLVATTDAPVGAVPGDGTHWVPEARNGSTDVDPPHPGPQPQPQEMTRDGSAQPAVDDGPSPAGHPRARKRKTVKMHTR